MQSVSDEDRVALGDACFETQAITHGVKYSEIKLRLKISDEQFRILEQVRKGYRDLGINSVFVGFRDLGRSGVAVKTA